MASHIHSHSPTHSHSHSHLILDPGSAYYDDAGGGFAPSSVIEVGSSRIQDQVAVAVAVGGGGAVAVAVAGLTKSFFNRIQKDFLINVWGYGIERRKTKISTDRREAYVTTARDSSVSNLRY